MDLQEGFVICTNSIKEKILREVQGFYNYIFMTQEELKKRLTFRLKKNAVFKLMQHYGFSYSVSLEYAKAIEYIEDKSYSNPKLDSIVSIFRFLKEQQLLEVDTLFFHRLRQFPVTFVDPEPTKEYITLKTLVSAYTHVYEVYPHSQHYTPKVYEFKTIEEECLFVMNQIKDLLKTGVCFNDIYIVHTNADYVFLLKRMARSFGIPIQFDSYSNILSTQWMQQFLLKCESYPSFSLILKELDSKNIIFPLVVDIINDYDLSSENPKECIEFIKAVSKKTKYPQKVYTEAIHLLDNTMVFDNQDYVFYVGFNLGSAPSIIKEDGFLNDQDLMLLNQSTSYEKNTLQYERLKQWISYTPHLTLTYKKYVKTESFLPSLLIEDLSLEVIQGANISYGYAKLEDELRLVGLFDLYEKYGQWHDDLEAYGIGEAKYKTYNHKYKPLSKNLMQEHFSLKDLRLAYSNVKLYFSCPFSYFADRILGLNEFKPKMAARMGSFSHAVLEDSYKSDFNFDQSVVEHKQEYAQDSKDEFFFTQMTSVLRNLIEFNRSHEAMSQLENVALEAHINVVKENYVFEGFIDKLLYTIKDQEVYAAIIDYKTGMDVVSLDNIEDGFHLQLPSYMYLLSHYEPFAGKEIHIIGLYLQKVNIVIFDHKSDIEVQMAKKFMLEGFSVANPKLLSMLDSTYQHSTYIKSLGMGKEGFLRYSKIFLEKDQLRITDMVEGLLNQASSQILDGHFPIEPKRINGKNVSCTYCQYKDICFYDYEDMVELTHKPFGKAGDGNGMD